MSKIYKNWKKICKITDHHVRYAFVHLDVETDHGRYSVDRYPEYFTHEEQAGPYPLSLLRMESHAYNVLYMNGNPNYDDCLVSNRNCHKYNIPWIPFQTPEMYGGLDYLPLPDELLIRRSVGYVFVWANRRWVVVESEWPYVISGLLHVAYFAAPAELIDVTR